MNKTILALTIATSLIACNSNDSPDELRAKAKQALATNENRTAEIHLKNLLRQEGKDAEARLQLAGVYAARGSWPSAEKELRRAEEYGVEPDRISIPLLIAMSHTAEPGASLREAAQRNSTDPKVRAKVLFYSAEAQQRLGDHEKSIKALEESLSLDPDLLKSRVNLLKIKAIADADLREQSIAGLAGLSDQHPSNINVLLAHGDLLRSDGQLIEAQQVFERAYELSPKNLLALSRKTSLEIARSQFDQAEPTVAKGLELAPGSPLLLTQKAQIDYSKGRHGPALDAAAGALNAAPDYAPAVAVAAAAALASGSVERAESYANKLRALAPSSIDGYRLLGAVLLAKGKTQEVLDLVGPIISKGNQDPTLLTLAGQAAMGSNNPAEARRFLESAVKFDTSDANARLYLALSKISTGDDLSGLDDLQAAAELDVSSPRANYALIGQLIKAGKFSQAENAIASLEKKQPGKAENRHIAGLLYLAQKKNASARAAFEDALQLNGSFYQSLGKLAAIDIAEGSRSNGIQRFIDALETDPDNEVLLLTLAQIHLSAPDSTDKAMALIGKARKANATSSKPVLLQAAVYLKQNETDKAVSSLRSGLSDMPDNSALLEALARAQRASGANEETLITIDKVTSQNPRNGGLQFRMAGLRASMADYRGALSGYRAAQNLAPRAIGPRLGEAIVHARMGNPQQAMAVARVLKTDMPENAAGWLLEGELQGAAGRWAQAAQAYGKGLEIDPEKQAIFLKMDGALRRSGKQKEADAELAKRLKTRPNDGELQRYAGDLASSRKQFKSAMKHYERAVAIAPADAIAWNNLAWAQQQAGDNRALTSGEKALELDPNSPATMDTVSSILVDAGELSRAISLQQNAVDAAPTNPGYRLRLAIALQQDKQLDAARRELTEIVTSYPSAPQAAEARKLLESL